MILTNLRYPTIDYCDWYKDTFITYLLKKEDCSQP